jgi:hypothetical protein
LTTVTAATPPEQFVQLCRLHATHRVIGSVAVSLALHSPVALVIVP